MTGTSAASAHHFIEQLDLLKKRLLEMSDRATTHVAMAVDALLKRDGDLARAVIVADHGVNRLEMEIDSLAVALLALHQPMARDLRLVVSALKISTDLERVSDHAVNIAESTLRLIEMKTNITPDPEMAEMARRAREMLDDALDALIKSDGELGRDVCARDDIVDSLHNSIYRIAISHMLEDTSTISAALELFLVSRNLERVADLATNIAEDAVYLAEGKTIKHRAELGSDTTR